MSIVVSRMDLELIKTHSVALMRLGIKECELNGHIQQVAFSAYHDALTQVCFTCKTVKTNINIGHLILLSKLKQIKKGKEGEG